MPEADHITDLRHSMEQAAKVPTSGVKGEYIEPMISAAKEQPPETQRAWGEKAAGLTQTEGQEIYKFNPDPAGQNISKSRIWPLMHPYNQKEAEAREKSIGYFKLAPPATSSMKHGTEVDLKIKQMADSLPKSNFVPEPTVRKVTEFPLFGGIRVVPYTTTDVNPQTRHMSYALNLFNDFEPVSTEDKAVVQASAKDLGVEEHLTAEGVPNPYKFSGLYDLLMVGRPNTAFAGKKLMVDVKAGHMDMNRPLDDVMRKANKQITEEAFYKFLYEKAGRGADEYGVFYSDSGHLALFSRDILQQRMDRDVMKFVQQIHREQSPFKSLIGLMKDEARV